MYYYEIVGVAVLAFRLSLLLPTINSRVAVLAFQLSLLLLLLKRLCGAPETHVLFVATPLAALFVATPTSTLLLVYTTLVYVHYLSISTVCGHPHIVLFVCSTLVLFVCSTLVLFMCSTLVVFVCATVVLFVCPTVVLFVCPTVVLFVCTTVCRILRLTTFNSLLQYVNWLVWEICSVN